MATSAFPIRVRSRRGSGPLGRTSILTFLVAAAPVVAIVHLAVAPEMLLLLSYGAVWAVGVAAAAVVGTRWERFDLSTFRAPGVFAVSFYVLVLLGAPTVVAHERGDPGASRFFVASCVAYLLTVLASSIVGPGHRRDQERRARTPLLIPGLLAMGLLIVAVLGVYVAVAPGIPLLDALRGARQDALRQGRQDALSTLPNEQIAFLFGFVRVVLLPFVTATLVVWWVRSRRVSVALAAVAVGAVAATTAMLTLEKSPLLRLLLIVAMAIAVECRIRVRSWQLVTVVVVAMAFPFVVTVLNNSAETSRTEVAAGLGRRAFIVPSEVSELYFEWAPEQTNGFLWGRTIPQFSKLTPEGPVNAPAEVHRLTTSGGRITGGSANASYVSFLWVDFGWAGVVAGSAAVGLALGGLQRGVDRLRPTVFGPSLQAVLSSQTVFLSMTSVFATVLQVPYGLVAVMAGSAVIWAFGRRGSVSPVPVGAPYARPAPSAASIARR